MRNFLRAGFQQLLFAAVAVGHTEGMDSRSLAAFHIKAAVADHPGFAAIRRQGFTDQMHFFSTGVRRADYRGKETVETEVFQDLSGGIGRFAGHDAQLRSLFPECPEHCAHTRIHPVFIHPDSGIPGAVDLLRFLRLFLGHAQIGPERMKQRRPDELAQGRCVRFGKTHFLRRVFRAVPDTFLRPGQRSVQIEKNPGVF